jgi:hypothetical protein
MVVDKHWIMTILPEMMKIEAQPSKKKKIRKGQKYK